MNRDPDRKTTLVWEVSTGQPLTWADIRNLIHIAASDPPPDDAPIFAKVTWFGRVQSLRVSTITPDDLKAWREEAQA